MILSSSKAVNWKDHFKPPKKDCVRLPAWRNQLFPANKIQHYVPDNKYRKHRRFLKSIGVIVASKHRKRVFKDSALCGDIKIVNKLMESQDKVERVPVGYVGGEDLPGFVSASLNQHREVNHLSWHDGAIPQNELFTKVGVTMLGTASNSCCRSEMWRHQI